jgi:hypothetical protein
MMNNEVNNFYSKNIFKVYGYFLTAVAEPDNKK